MGCENDLIGVGLLTSWAKPGRSYPLRPAIARRLLQRDSSEAGFSAASRQNPRDEDAGYSNSPSHTEGCQQVIAGLADESCSPQTSVRASGCSNELLNSITGSR